MKKPMLKIMTLSLLAAAIVAAPVLSCAQDVNTNAPAASTPKHQRHGAPFHGTINALDANAMTLTVGKLTIQVTSETKITKDGKPATLADGAVGEPVSGYYKKDADGKLNAMTIHFGGKKKEVSDSSSTNSAGK